MTAAIIAPIYVRLICQINMAFRSHKRLKYIQILGHYLV
jgi:hypothetical protein